MIWANWYIWLATRPGVTEGGRKMQTRILSFLHTWRLLIILLLFICLPLTLTGCGSKNSRLPPKVKMKDLKITLADGNWASIQMHNRLAGYIIKNGYGYPVEYLSGEELPLMKALAGNDIQIMMEIWGDDFPVEWKNMQTQLKVKNMGTNYTGAAQGWFVPSYMINGDVERGIEPIATDLKYAADLPRFADLFPKHPSSQKSLLYNAPSTWVVAGVNQTKLKSYGLSRSFTLAATDSESNLINSLQRHYQKGTPWLGFARDPSPITANCKMTMLREPPYDDVIWKKNRACSFPTTDVLIAANRSLEKTAPELLDFLDKYETTYDQNIQILQYLEKYKGNADKATIAFMKEKPDIWKAWIPDDQVIKYVDASLAAEVLE